MSSPLSAGPERGDPGCVARLITKPKSNIPPWLAIFTVPLVQSVMTVSCDENCLIETDVPFLGVAFTFNKFCRLPLPLQRCVHDQCIKISVSIFC